MMPRRAAIALFAGVLALTAARAETILNRGNLAEPGTLDPAQQTLVGEYEIMSDLFMGLMQISPQGLPIPGAAESWSVSADGRTTTFKLREGLVWSDGVKLTAEDFVFTFRRALDPKTRSPLAGMVYKIKNGAAVNAGKLPLSALGVSAPDARTFVVELGEPSPVLSWLLTQPVLWPVPRHVIAKHPTDWTKPGILVSNGPYVLKEWRPHDHVTLVKNPRFFEAAKVKIDTVNYYPIDDVAAAVKRFRAGELDLNMDFPPQDAARLKQILPKGSVLTSTNFRIVYLAVNHLKPPFNDVRVRRAVSLAIDREVLTGQILRLGEVPNTSLMPVGLPGFTQGAPDFAAWPMAKRREEATRLLAAAGYSAARPLKFEFDIVAGLTQKRVAVAIADMLKSVGIAVELRAEDTPVHYGRLRVRDFTMGTVSWLQVPDPEFYTYLLLTSSTEENYGGYSNPKFDAKHAEAARTVDMKKRMALFREADQIALNDAAQIPLYTSVNRSLVAPYVKGWEENPLAEHPTRWMWLEKK
ncbi:MAG: peptide ABC transporter substrate-binding protein [Alphaproteobacteria bacterium]|nr:peptide ABC transporter substrate-binding protein [Alphaproteobacteria bacterium]